jgi:hypothetical protein
MCPLMEPNGLLIREELWLRRSNRAAEAAECPDFALIMSVNFLQRSNIPFSETGSSVVVVIAGKARSAYVNCLFPRLVLRRL